MSDPTERFRLQIGNLLRTTVSQLEALRTAVVRSSERGRRELDLTLLRRDRARALRDLGEAAAAMIASGELEAHGPLGEPWQRLVDATGRMEAAVHGTSYGEGLHEAFVAGAGALRGQTADEIFDRDEDEERIATPSPAAARAADEVFSDSAPASAPAAVAPAGAAAPAAKKRAPGKRAPAKKKRPPKPKQEG